VGVRAVAGRAEEACEPSKQHVAKCVCRGERKPPERGDCMRYTERALRDRCIGSERCSGSRMCLSPKMSKNIDGTGWKLTAEAAYAGKDGCRCINLGCESWCPADSALWPDPSAVWLELGALAAHDLIAALRFCMRSLTHMMSS